ncbi:MAG: 2Fe-2S iron-sulfur cluster-binding protein [Bacteroidetes bacterium]|nr:2Fe-2S iron-sulfur cluster-binding protein [Bacteroidota bacterium]
MLFTIEINDQKVSARRGETILTVLNRSGIRVPTLCHLNGYTPTGSCRLCVVEVEGIRSLIPSCSAPVEEWMKIRTHTPRVLKARRTIVELLLANHPDDCFYCDRSGGCELQALADELNVHERKYMNRRKPVQVDRNCPAIERNPAKCILCERCIRVCDEMIGVSAIEIIGRGNKSQIGTGINKGLNYTACVKCGQCIMVCPTNALKEKTTFPNVVEALNNRELYPVIQFSPTVPVSIADEIGIKPGKDIMTLLRTAMQRIGFKQVFDSSFGADINIMEVAAELAQRIKTGENLPLFTSCCPAWVKYIQDTKPEYKGWLSTTKSPQLITGEIFKRYFAPLAGIPGEKVFMVSVMPCTAKKYESVNEQSKSEVDAVITTRELLKMIRMLGIDFTTLEPEQTASSNNIRSSAGVLFGAAGGALEGILRTLHFQLTGEELANYKIPELRGFKGRKEGKIMIGKTAIGYAAISGLANAKSLMNEIKAGRNDLHIIEIMACPNGCINGGGQPFDTSEKSIRSRMKALHDTDDTELIRVAHKNPLVSEIYSRLLGQPNSELSKELLHITYADQPPV